MHSSYSINNFAPVFRSVVSAFQPTLCVELGVLEGYSTVAIAKGLKENFEKGGGRGHLSAHDLFEEYRYRHAALDAARANIEAAGVQDFVTLYQQNAIEVADDYSDGSVHLLHVDLSNTGETVRWVMEAWDQKMVQGGIILFEGGTDERDQVEWMKKYGGTSIKQELENNKLIAEKYVFGTYMPFPGLTCLLKKR